MPRFILCLLAMLLAFELLLLLLLFFVTIVCDLLAMIANWLIYLAAREI